ncbi:thymidylate kinase [Thermodesulfitimonas autotrophica]|uniref:Thymidylate kinase n=1 Tax=Thermodesulfitimonas autotrophica TaxID=1894989 RepID=A0A3N5API6_9THEO|nr:dTMP kinase [Thermodesulfitimonas autotrophica]RPF47146.1 thymidylate kinase [Thermodesulfitimonas autotrophica]
MGFFISFEGIDGAGKSTQVQRLARRLAALGFDVVTVREPGGTPLGETLREILRNPVREMDPRAEACLYAAARAELVDRVILPALRAGKVVLADRFTDSTLAYQGAGRGLSVELLSALNAFVTQGLSPDCTVIIDLPVAAALARVGAPGERDRMERLGPAFFSRVREYYLHLAGQDPTRYLVVDGGRAPEAVEAEIFRLVKEALGRCTR